VNKGYFGYVYRVTNTVNGKTYVGKRYYSSDKNKLWNSYLGSGDLIKKAVLKYGKDSFKKELLLECPSQHQLGLEEVRLIAEEKMTERGEYNQSVFVPTFSFQDLTPDAQKRFSEISRQTALSHAHKKKERWEAIHREFDNKYGDAIVESFARLQSARKVASELGFSVKKIERVLLNRNVARNHRNVPGVYHSLETKRKISGRASYDGVSLRDEKTLNFKSVYTLDHGHKLQAEKEQKCKNCGKVFFRKEKRSNCSKECVSRGKSETRKGVTPSNQKLTLSDKLAIVRLYHTEKKSLYEIAKLYNVHYRTVHAFMVRQDIPRRSSEESARITRPAIGRKLFTHICANCGNIFSSSKKAQKNCSRRCGGITATNKQYSKT
jgi:predicted  nucleic acid-binding Zn-ribbon protein